jgi:hypothetical protein
VTGFISIEIENNVRFFVFCPECEKILYKTPAKEMTGIYKRVALNTVGRHNETLGHNAQIVVRKISTNETHRWTEINAFMPY